MSTKRKKTYVKQMFVVAKNNDKEFTFDDRSVLRKKTSIVTSLSQPPQL